MNDAHHRINVEFRKRPGECCTPAFGRISVPPHTATKHPSEFKSRPSFWIEETESTDQIVAIAFGNCPHPIATKMPVAHEQTDESST